MKKKESVCKVLVIDEDNNVIAEDVSEEVAAEIVSRIENEDDCGCESSGCEEICEYMTKMLAEIGIETEDHDEMIKELEDLKLVKKDVNTESNKTKKLIKTKEKKIKKIKPKKIVRKKKIEMCGCE